MMEELRNKSGLINQYSATRSAGSQSVEKHNRYVSSLLDSTGKQGYTHKEFAQKRYGNKGQKMLQTLQQLGPGMEDLISDPALVSKSHLASFSKFATQTAQQS